MTSDIEQAFDDNRILFQNSEIDLIELVLVLWKGKWIVAITTFAAAMILVVYSLSLPNIYRAEVLLAPISGGDSGRFSALASQYAGLASLAGINLGSGSNVTDKSVLGMEVLQSRKFLGEFAIKRDILPELFASKNWDLSTGKIIYDQEIFDENTSTWTRQVSPPLEPLPSSQEAYEELRSILSVSQDSETGFIRVAIEHYSPYIAKNWVDWLIEDINSEIKSQDINEAEKSIAYLKEQLELTSFAALQSVFYQLIEDQIQTVMLANARPEYLFRTIDPSVVEQRKYGPNRAFICIFGVFIALLLSSVFVVFINIYRRT